MFFDQDPSLQDVDIDPPTPGYGKTPNEVNAPTLWGACNLPPALVEKMIIQKVMSYDAITVFPCPKRDPDITHLGNVINL